MNDIWGFFIGSEQKAHILGKQQRRGQRLMDKIWGFFIGWGLISEKYYLSKGKKLLIKNYFSDTFLEF